MRVAHFYHCWCGGAWRPIVQRHLSALRAAEGFPGELHVGLVGPPAARDEARALFRGAFPGCGVFEGDEGHEPFTLGRVHDWACAHPDGAVLYAHTHGSWHVSGPHEQNQRKMIRRLVVPWRGCVASLEAGAAVVGDGPLGGNMWWARCDWLRRLERPEGTGREPNGEIWSADTDCWVWPARSAKADDGVWLAQPPGGHLSDQDHARLQGCKRDSLRCWRRGDWAGVRAAVRDGLALDPDDWEMMVTGNRLRRLQQTTAEALAERVRDRPPKAAIRDGQRLLRSAYTDPAAVAMLRQARTINGAMRHDGA